jgi:probable DNA metabolism protein
MYLIYDNTFEGLLSAVFEVYEHKLTTACIRKEAAAIPSLFEAPLKITTNELKTQRVLNKLRVLIGEEGIHKLWRVWLTEEASVEDCILGTIQYAIEQNTNVLSDFGNLPVLQLNQQLKKIGREKHRMEAFVRFQLTKDKLYYAAIEPDFNVLPLLIKHFQSRYADQRWMIFDLRRHYGIYYDLNKTEFITFEEESADLKIPAKELFQENEVLYQTLWKDYFKSTNIQSRKNSKLHLQHVPRRYWKYLTEKGIDFD